MDLETLLHALRTAKEQGHSDEDIALLAAAYVEAYTPLPVNEMTIACAMLMIAGVRVTEERAEQLLVTVTNRGLLIREDGE